MTVIGPINLEREKPAEPDWNKIDCNRAQSHDEADLCEQRRMAKAAEETLRWTEAGVLASAFGAVISFFGTIFLIWNLRLVKRSNDIALDMLKIEGRAYLAIASFTFNRVMWEDKSTGIDIRPVVKNLGKGPALAAQIAISRRVQQDGDDAPINWKGDFPSQECTIHIGPGVDVDIIAPLQISSADLKAINDGKLRVFYLFHQPYLSMLNGDKVMHHTDQCFELKVFSDPSDFINDPGIGLPDVVQMHAVAKYGVAT